MWILQCGRLGEGSDCLEDGRGCREGRHLKSGAWYCQWWKMMMMIQDTISTGGTRRVRYKRKAGNHESLSLQVLLMMIIMMVLTVKKMPTCSINLFGPPILDTCIKRNSTSTLFSSHGGLLDNPGLVTKCCGNVLDKWDQVTFTFSSHFHFLRFLQYFWLLSS